jgi:hypothetical protein
MDTQKSKFAIRLLPSLADFAFLMPIAFLFGRMDGLVTLLGDCDTGWHIRTGQWILANGRVPAQDVFSFSKAGQPWFAWEWLSDIILAWFNAAGGLKAVSMLSILLLAVTFTLLFQLVRRKANAVVAILITMLAAIASSIHWLARPHLFTLVFLVLFYTALERMRDGETKAAGIPFLAILPAATVVWTNLHAGFFVGVLMIAAYGCGELLQIVVRGGEAAVETRLKARRYFLCAAACMAASLINPYGYHLHAHMAAYLQDPWNAQHIVEFLSPSFHHPAAIFFELMLALAGITAGWSLIKGRFTEPLLMLIWAHAGLLASRNIPIFMIAAAPPVAAAMEEWLAAAPEWNLAGWLRKVLSRFSRMARETSETEEIGRWHLVAAFGVAMVAALIWAPNPPPKFRAEFTPSRYPAAALATLRSDRDARIFTNDEWGDYLIWRLYPEHKVFVDGRSDFYGDEFEEKYIGVINAKYDWQKTLEEFGVDTILLPPDAPLTGALKETNRWRVVYDDGVALVFRSATRTAGAANSVAAVRGGGGRDREVTKTDSSDRAITQTKSKT